MKALRPIAIDGDFAHVPLTRGYVTIIDIGDIGLVDGHNWSANVHTYKDGSVRSVYAVRVVGDQFGRQKMVYMHRVISETPSGFETDHRDGDGTNNRRVNLRTASVAENQHNRRINLNSTSGIKGVVWNKAAKKWQSQIRIGGKAKHLGLFVDAHAAAAAYAMASATLHGNFGRVS